MVTPRGSRVMPLKGVWILGVESSMLVVEGFTVRLSDFVDLMELHSGLLLL